MEEAGSAGNVHIARTLTSLHAGRPPIYLRSTYRDNMSHLFYCEEYYREILK